MPDWQRVQHGHTIPAGQPHREFWTDERLGEFDYRRIHTYDLEVPASAIHEHFVDASWHPPLPTEPGSVILARRLEGPARYWLRGEDRWVDGEGGWSRVDREVDFYDVRVLFDPSVAER